LASPYIGLQTRYNLLDRSLEWELGPMAKAYDIGIIPWGALAEGFLTGKVSIASANQSPSLKRC